jgi:hypothetical protein
MRRLLVVAALLTVPVLNMAQQPATPSAPPLAPKMASDGVAGIQGLQGNGVLWVNDYKGKSGKAKIFPKTKPGQ